MAALRQKQFGSFMSPAERNAPMTPAASSIDMSASMFQLPVAKSSTSPALDRMTQSSFVSSNSASWRSNTDAFSRSLKQFSLSSTPSSSSSSSSSPSLTSPIAPKLSNSSKTSFNAADNYEQPAQAEFAASSSKSIGVNRYQVSSKASLDDDGYQMPARATFDDDGYQMLSNSAPSKVSVDDGNDGYEMPSKASVDDDGYQMPSKATVEPNDNRFRSTLHESAPSVASIDNNYQVPERAVASEGSYQVPTAVSSDGYQVPLPARRGYVVVEDNDDDDDDDDYAMPEAVQSAPTQPSANVPAKRRVFGYEADDDAYVEPQFGGMFF